jgi:hypothetical protein
MLGFFEGDATHAISQMVDLTANANPAVHFRLVAAGTGNSADTCTVSVRVNRASDSVLLDQFGVLTGACNVAFSTTGNEFIPILAAGEIVFITLEWTQTGNSGSGTFKLDNVHVEDGI